jgi:nucleoside 2-deoxyribosyltransferase
LVEIGYAISKGKKCIIIVKDRDDLPFLLQEADKRITNLKIYVIKDFSNIQDFLLKGKKGLFTFDRI